MLVIPLVMTSIICGVARVGKDKDFGRLGIKTILFYSLTGLLAVIVGILYVNFIEPGQVEPEIREKMLSGENKMDSGKLEQAFENADNGWKGIFEIFQRMIPQNLSKQQLKVNSLDLFFSVFYLVSLSLDFLTSIKVLNSYFGKV